MAYYIKKTQKIGGKSTDLFHIGEKKWSHDASKKKLYNTEEEANAEVYGPFRGSVVSE